MKWHPGDKIRIKPYLACFENRTGLFFLPSMKPFCGMTGTLKKIIIKPKVWKIEDIDFLWHENWFEVPGHFSFEILHTVPFFSDEDFEL